jgi:hypothetical protein
LVDLSFANGTSIISHDETMGVPGFTGVDLVARALYQGYNYMALAEILEATSWDYRSQQTFPPLEERGASSMRNLMNTVYHLSGAMYEGRDAGVGAYLKTVKINSTTWREEYRFGALVGYRHTASPFVLGAGQVVTYPCDRISNVPTSFNPANESPNPFPNSSQSVGPPIYLKVDDGQVLSIDTFNVRQGGTLIPSLLLNNSNDPQRPKEVGVNEAFVVPSSPLTANTSYAVTVTGTVDNVAFTRSFTFSTGS